jgi:hypothetical protein
MAAVDEVREMMEVMEVRGCLWRGQPTTASNVLSVQGRWIDRVMTQTDDV